MFIDDLDIDDYHSMPQLSKTGLDMVNISPATYFANYLSENRPPQKVRAGQLEGNLAHCTILEPDHFNDRYYVLEIDAPDRPTKAMLSSKNPSESSLRRIGYWKEVDEKADGKTIITQDQYEIAWRQRDSVMASPAMKEIFSSGIAERSVFWTDESTGVACRCRPDWVNELDESTVLIADVKTYNSVSLADIRRQIERKRYNIQDAYYSDGYEAGTKKNVAAFVFVFVSTEYPYHAIPVKIRESDRKISRVRYIEDLKAFRKAQITGDWSFTDADKIHTLELSKYI